jgi:hypothetical protein
MLDLCFEALAIVERLAAGEAPTADDRQGLRRALLQAREVLPDAGFPAEATWRGMQRASIGTETSFDQADPLYWRDVAQELRDAGEVLKSLVSPDFRRESDFHIVG